MRIPALIIGASLLASTAAFADLIAVPQQEQAPVNRIDTPEYDRVQACAYRLARVFRYDFDHPEISAAKQALAAFYDTCKTEIAALVAAYPNWTAYAPRKRSFKEIVEGNALIAFQNTRYDIYRSEGPAPALPPVGGNDLRRDARWAIVAHPSAISSDEVARVIHHEAYGYGARVSFHGTVQGWRYTYEGNTTTGTPPKGWQATLDKGDTEVWIKCNSWNAPEAACLISVGSFLELRAGGDPLKITSVCNPGGQGLVLDAPQPAEIKARESSLVIDGGEPIALPDGDDCIDDRDGKLAARILAAHKVTVRYKPPFSARFVTYAGSNEFLAPTLTVARRVFAIVHDPEAHAQILADINDAVARSPPFTLIDALRGEYEWQRAVDCLSRDAPAKC